MADDFRPPTNSEFFRVLQAWIGATYPGVAAEEIRILLTTGKTLRQPVTMPTQAPPPPTPAEAKQKEAREERKTVRRHAETRGKILSYLSEHPDNWFDRKKLAPLANCKYNPTYRTTLRQLISEKLIETRNDDKVKIIR